MIGLELMKSALSLTVWEGGSDVNLTTRDFNFILMYIRELLNHLHDK